MGDSIQKHFPDEHAGNDENVIARVVRLDETHANGLDSGEENQSNACEYHCQQSGNSQR